ncbi:MAG: MoxR family ATPase [Oceanococcaceae bacterium]
MSLHTSFAQLEAHLSRQILGQQQLVQRLLIALLADGHLLVEGAPGLAKTTAVKALASGLEADFHRLQFTPDLLPGDLIGTDVFRPDAGIFAFTPGPLFHNILLADEINRAPAKVQSALLEAMAERQITVGQTTHPLPEPFLVMATQNPIEQEGTYPLPEAQMDRFLMKVRVDYPDAATEKAILQLARATAHTPAAAAPAPLTSDAIRAARQDIFTLHLAEAVEDYLVELIVTTRAGERHGRDWSRWIAHGGSPRATIALERCARAHAWLCGRDHVAPDDVQAIAADVLRHRLILHYEAEAEGLDADTVIRELLHSVPVA